MDYPSCESVIQKLGQVSDLYHRLLIVVARDGSGKTTLLHQLRDRIHAPIINVNVELSKRLLDMTERQRALQLPRCDVSGNEGQSRLRYIRPPGKFDLRV